jgi:hypothetical protein
MLWNLLCVAAIIALIGSTLVSIDLSFKNANELKAVRALLEDNAPAASKRGK